MRLLENRVHDLENGVHKCNCSDCYQIDPSIAKYYPVYSFGDLEGKPIWVVGINPAHAEYDGKNGGVPYLSRSMDIKQRRCSQLSYFNSKPYDFFRNIEQFFGGEVSDKVVEWKTKPWEKVGFVDLVKCVTKDGWSQLKPDEQQALVGSCESYVENQLMHCRHWLKLIIAYGKPVREWFSSRNLQNHHYQKYQSALVDGWAVCFIDQTGRNLSAKDIELARRSIIEAFKLLGCDRF